MATMLDLTKNKYSSQWIATNAKMSLEDAMKLIHQKAPISGPSQTLSQMKPKWEKIIGTEWTDREWRQIWDYTADFVETKKVGK
jgi:hypothetical protein